MCITFPYSPDLLVTKLKQHTRWYVWCILKGFNAKVGNQEIPGVTGKFYFANKGPSSQSYGFSSCHVWMWELGHEESWESKNWCFWTVVLEKTLESPLDYKEIEPVHPKGNQSWIFIGRTDVEAEAPILWPSDAKNWLTGKDPVAGKDWKQEEKRVTENEIVGWHHQLDGMSLSKLQELVMGREAWP